MGCNRIADTKDLGGLTPAEPIATCLCDGEDPRSIYHGGGLSPFSAWYIVRRGAAFAAIRSLEELRNEFAPIETPEEALSFVLAATGPEIEARFDVKPEARLRYYVPRLEDTYVTATEDGFLVHNLYTVESCPDILGTVDVRVSGVGEVTYGTVVLVADLENGDCARM
jgi:hypothetical protein